MPGVMTDALAEALSALLEEIHVGPPNPKSTWITTNAPGSGVLGTLQSMTPELASRPAGQGMTTIAAHAAHLLFSLRLACRAARGENAYAGIDWGESWRTSTVDDTSWGKLKDELRRAHADLLAALHANPPWDQDDFLKGAIALVGHGAYHLGAIRQIHRMLTAGSLEAGRV